MSATATIQTARAAGRQRGSVLDACSEREDGHALPLPASERSRSALPGASDSPNSGASITSNCATLSRQEEQYSGSGVSMARKRYQK